MTDKKALTVRFSPDEIERLNTLSEKYGVTQSTAARWAVEALIQYVDAHGGELHLPIDLSAEWKKIKHQEDLRPLRVAEESADGYGPPASSSSGGRKASPELVEELKKLPARVKDKLDKAKGAAKNA